MFRHLVLGLSVLLSAGAFATSAAAETASGRYIVVLTDNSNPSRVVQKHEKKYAAEALHVYRHALKGYAAKVPASRLAALEADPQVRFVARDRVVTAATDIATAQTLPTGVDRIDGDLSSTRSGDGSGAVSINVAVLDSLIDSTHPDLNVAGVKDCISGEPAKVKTTHGTHVAGTIAALDNSLGVVGVAPGARVWSVRVLNDKGFGFTSQIVCGIDFVTSTRTDVDRTNDIAVANMSLGGPGADDENCGNTNNDAMHKAICASTAAEVTYVVAAGNESVDIQSRRPAGYDEVLTVAGMADYDGRPGGLASAPGGWCSAGSGDDSFATFSNFATLQTDIAHTIAAPGVCILSTAQNGGYFTTSGTSMASPHVAGVVALCIAQTTCRGRPQRIIEKIISETASFNTAPENAAYGFQGDPLRPISGKYYGYLIRAGLY